MLKMKIEIEPEGFDQVKQFQKRMKSIETLAGEYGYFGGKTYESEWSRSNDFTEAGLMALLTFGTTHAGNGSVIPPRNVFLGAGIAFKGERKAALATPIKRLVESSSRGSKDFDKYITQIAKVMREYTQSKFGMSGSIGGVNIKPNKEEWARRKGENSPLHNTGTLKEAMTERSSKGDI